MDLEYKVIQSTVPYFAKPANLKQTLHEEAQAGWQLVEKFDNFKIRLQRDIAQRDSDHTRQLDPYRCHVGPSNAVTYSVTAVLTILVVLAIFVAVGAI
ncbi:hypothetical protein [Pseudohongiella sp. O18]|uniref:hypothetical protein n=1 Tax=Pseudohongiella sp. O18 TaxID=2904248 RepID=UPI001F35BED6|nr:hypothetical protein [Pseudohongiella sp. O18]